MCVCVCVCVCVCGSCDVSALTLAAVSAVSAVHLTPNPPCTPTSIYPTQMDWYAGLGIGYRYYTGTPVVPFGHGLSYTSFGYSSLTTNVTGAVGPCDFVGVSVKVTNTGSSVTSDEVVQLYLVQNNASVPVGLSLAALDYLFSRFPVDGDLLPSCPNAIPVVQSYQPPPLRLPIGSQRAPG